MTIVSWVMWMDAKSGGKMLGFGWFRQRWLQAYPKPLESFFVDHRCPDCGAKNFMTWQDGGHDFAMECQECKAKFGVQAPPFNLIERIGR
jgi:hypothetical protein